jgi:hypothetical protein
MQKKTNIVSQHDCEHGGVGGDGGPSDGLTQAARIPNGILDGVDNRCGLGGEGEEEDERNGEGTHYLGWRGVLREWEEEEGMREMRG